LLLSPLQAVGVWCEWAECDGFLYANVYGADLNTLLLLLLLLWPAAAATLAGCWRLV
jgi:hypothetical protein